ncbi:MAG: glycosyltransferase family 39 protein [Puniceicoccales bacterium]|jgi:hypothetical protein|nr:glycosyltransferase family 39 protein [Puniceicoccales bacterium]
MEKQQKEKDKKISLVKSETNASVRLGAVRRDGMIAFLARPWRSLLAIVSYRCDLFYLTVLGWFGLCFGGLLLLPATRMVIVTFVSRFHKLTPEFWQGKLFLWAGLLVGASAVALFITTPLFDAIAARKKLADRLLTGVGWGLVFLFLVRGIYFASGDASIWLDEGSSFLTARLSWREILETQVLDVHPPLYFLLLKLFTLLFGESIFAGKLFSVVPMVLALSAGWLFLSKEFSKKSGILFVSCFFVLFPVVRFSVEIRMYSWALFFVMMTAISAWFAARTDKVGWWVSFSVFLAVTAYTHHYAAMMAAVGGGIFFIHTLVWDRGKVRKVVLCGVAALVLYSPWIHVAMSHFSGASENFWIRYSAEGNPLNCLLFDFRGSNIVFTGFLLLNFLAALFAFATARKRSAGDVFVFYGLLCFFAVYAVGLCVVIFVSPLMIERYLVPALGLIWLFVAAEHPALRNARCLVALCAACCAMSFVSMGEMLDFKRKDGKKYIHFEKELSGVGNSAAALVVFPTIMEDGLKGAGHCYSVISYVLPRKPFYLPPNVLAGRHGREWLKHLIPEVYYYDEALDLTQFSGKKALVFVSSKDRKAKREIPKEWSPLTHFPYWGTDNCDVYLAEDAADVGRVYKRIYAQAGPVN